MGQYVQPIVNTGDQQQQASLTIGDALEAAARASGEKPVDHSDAAAIQAAEVRATGSNVTTPGGLAASAQSAADYNQTVSLGDDDKVKLGTILMVTSYYILWL